MSAAQRGIRRQGAESTGMTDSTADGRDYLVSYLLNEYQRGSMVMRFRGDPGQPELFRELFKYGLNPAALKDVAATRVADVKDQGARYAQAQRASEAAQAHDRTLRARHTSSSKSQWSDSPPRTTRKRGVLGPLIFVAILVYGLLVSMASYSFNLGTIEANFRVDSSLGVTLDTCRSALGDRAEFGLGIYGENPGLFTDRPSTFPAHPANAAFLLGCLTG